MINFSVFVFLELYCLLFLDHVDSCLSDVQCCETPRIKEVVPDTNEDSGPSSGEGWNVFHSTPNHVYHHIIQH